MPTPSPRAGSWEAALRAAGGAGRSGRPGQRGRRWTTRSAWCARRATTPRPIRRWASACSTTWPSPPPGCSPAAAPSDRDPRLRRPPRQRHPGRLLRPRRRAVRLDAPVPALPGHRPLARNGRGAGAGYTLNLALPPGSGDEVYAGALDADRRARRAALSRPTSSWSRSASTRSGAIRWPLCGCRSPARTRRCCARRASWRRAVRRPLVVGAGRWLRPGRAGPRRGRRVPAVARRGAAARSARPAARPVVSCRGRAAAGRRYASCTTWFDRSPAILALECLAVSPLWEGPIGNNASTAAAAQAHGVLSERLRACVRHCRGPRSRWGAATLDLAA